MERAAACLAASGAALVAACNNGAIDVPDGVLAPESELRSPAVPPRTSVQSAATAPAGRARRTRQEQQLTGRVLDRSGAAVSAATVRMRGTMKPDTLARTWTAGDGAFALSPGGAIPAAVRIEIEHPGYATLVLRRAVAGDAVRGSTDLGAVVLTDGGRCVGRIVAPGGGIHDATVTLVPVDGEVGAGTPVRTDAHGGFRSGRLHAGAYRVVATAPGFVTGGPPRWIEVRDGMDLDVGSIRLERARALTGTVRDAAGRAVNGALVIVAWLAQDSGGVAAWQWQRAASDADGNFTVRQVPPRTLHCRVEKRGYLTWQGPALPTGQLDIRVEPALTIRGVVIDGLSDQPVERFAIRARRVTPPARGTSPRGLGPARPGLTRGTRTSAGRPYPPVPSDAGAETHHHSGRFELGDLQEGVYELRVHAVDFCVPGVEIEVRRGDTAPWVRVDLRRAR